MKTWKHFALVAIIALIGIASLYGQTGANFPPDFVGTWKRDNFSNTITITASTFKSSSQTNTRNLMGISGDDYTITNYAGTGTFTFSIRLINGNLVISGDSGPNQDNWDGIWKKQADAATLLRLNLPTVLGPSQAEEMMRRFVEISPNIISEGTDARNDVAWRRNWIERLTKTEELFNLIFSSRGLPYNLFYSTGIQQGRINYQTETVELSTSINLRMSNEWINILDGVFQTIKKIDDELQGTGRRSDWGLNDWPNIGVTQTNPFSTRYSGGGFDGVTRTGTQWKTDFSIVFELLNDKNQVIGRQTFDLSPYFEIYCYREPLKTLAKK